MKRFNIAMNKAHFLANLMDPRFRGERLSEEQLYSAMEYALTYYSDAMPDLIEYKAKYSPFKEYLFSPATLEEIKPPVCAVASSVGIENILSTFRYVYSSVRNRLGTEKAA
ncbi:hypothetical protein PR048_023486 [Dryococelus australis]|uniref:Uncharacterized protein n=1 Tax=Dryococelus australis TaxID=614101 RepID=A0ABQ9GU70_9NEOP|nr:hypothetical protein PR048_023486 [Dryococelus australis]